MARAVAAEGNQQGTDDKDHEGTGEGHSVSEGRSQDRLVGRLGPLEIDWPRSIGYFGGVALAVGLEIIDPPLAIFIVAIPFIKMLNLSEAPLASRFVGQVFEGVAKPLGGDTEGTVRMVTATEGASGDPVD